MTSATDQRIARNTKTFLAHRDRTQTDLARHLAMDPGSLSKALRGKRKWSATELVSLADFLDVTTERLIADPESNVRSRCTSQESRSVVKRSRFLIDS